MHELPIEHKHLQSSGGWKSTADTIQRSIKDANSRKLKICCPASTILSPRIDSPSLLLSNGSLPHRKCYLTWSTTSEGGRDEEPDKVDHAARTGRGYQQALSHGGPIGQETDTG